MGSPIFPSYLAQQCASVRTTGYNHHNTTQDKARRGRKQAQSRERKVSVKVSVQCSSLPTSSWLQFTLVTYLPSSISALCCVVCLLDWSLLLLKRSWSSKINVLISILPPPLYLFPLRDEGGKRAWQAVTLASTTDLCSLKEEKSLGILLSISVSFRLIITFWSLSFSAW